MNYMKYNRALVMLEEQNSGFCAKEGPVRGHLKVETGNGKGALRCTVQNLKYYPRGEYIYKLILFGKKGERTLHAIVGTLVVNRYGNSETYFRFNPVDVDDRGSRYSDYFTAIVAAVSTRDATEPLHPVLKGLLENDDGEREPEHRLSAESLIKAAGTAPQTAASDSQSLPKSEADPQSALRHALPKSEAEQSEPEAAPQPISEPVQAAPKSESVRQPASKPAGRPVPQPELQPASQLKPRPAPQSEPQPVPQPVVPMAETTEPETALQAASKPAGRPKPQPELQPASQLEPQPELQSKLQPVPQSKLQPVPQPVVPMAETTGPESETGLEMEQEAAASSSQTWDDTHNYNGFYNEYLLNVCGYTCKVADYYEEVRPFDSDRTQARWKKIVNVENLPLVSPGAHHFAAQYRHYLFGARPGENGMAERFYFGIPGRFLETEQPDGGRSGFTFWQPMRGADREKTAYGYWIVSVDAKTGNIEDV